MKTKKEKLRKAIDKIDKYFAFFLVPLIFASAIFDLFRGVWLLAIWKLAAVFSLVTSIAQGVVNRRLVELAKKMLRDLESAFFTIELYKKKYGKLNLGKNKDDLIN